MHYLGSKARHAKEITAITLAGRRADQVYVEPFVGGGNVIVNVPQGAGRIANDKNYAMVALLDAIGNRDWLPPETMTEKEWRAIMKWQTTSLKDPQVPLEERPWNEQALFAFAATGPTFGSMWAGQWAKDDADKPKGTRYRQARDAAIRDREGLRGVEFHSGSFADLVIPDGALVYCDPPYAGTTGYSGATTKTLVGESAEKKNVWSAPAFWKWADDLVNRGCSVYVSEYKGPPTGTFKAVATPEQAAELAAAREAAKKLDSNDQSIPSSVFEEARYRINEAEAAIAGNVQSQMDAWKVVWEKQVTSDFSASRSKDNEIKRMDAWRKYLRATPEYPGAENEVKWFKGNIPAGHTTWPPGHEAPAVMGAGKKETEKLFHREA